MKMQARWTARELLVRNGFEEGNFATKYSLQGGSIVSPAEHDSSHAQTCGHSSHAAGDDYPDYVLCLVGLLCARGIKYAVLQDPEIGSHNVDMLDSFVFRDKLYVVERRMDCSWFASLPTELQAIFDATAVIVEYVVQVNDV